MDIARWRIYVRGIVQGVGFRPFVYRVASRYALSGWVRNTSDGVLIEAEAPRASFEDFVQTLREECPPQAHIMSISHEILSVERNSVENYSQPAVFAIIPSENPSVCKTFLPPDLAACADCLSELMDPGDRRYQYPFTNCTNCGPRFSIIIDIPYDRPRTTMRVFQMCPACDREYHDTADRRFHAQPNACQRCGPRVHLAQDGRVVRRQKAIDKAAEELQKGKILAIKGLGGYHLACDATNPDAVQRLRLRKGRGNKPLALMVRDLEMAQQLAVVSSVEKDALSSVQAPIVLLEPHRPLRLHSWIAPGSPRLGIMLPYTPLHHLLCKAVDRPLVMTSGNLAEEPLAYKDEEVVKRLSAIADLFLVHNRPIARPCDDSVAVVWRGRPRLIRRSRGYVPKPVALPYSEGFPPFIAVGGDLKNTFCLVSHEGICFLSQHLGDLESPESQQNFCDALRDLCRLLDVEPAAVVVDAHPGYYSRRLAERAGYSLPTFTIQHHEAHLASCLAENDVRGPVIGISWDGTGYGTDGAIWGGEFFVGSTTDMRRIATFQTFRLPGGYRAILEPWRIALALLFDLYGDDLETNLPPALHEVPAERHRLVKNLLVRGINSPACTSVGRLFDGVTSMLGLRQTITFEAEAALALESCQIGTYGEPYPFRLDVSRSPWRIEISAAIKSILADLRRDATPREISARFHGTLAWICLEVCREIKAERGLNRVALSGGVFQNLSLLDKVCDLLEDEGFRVYTHAEIPANDGGLSYGQAAVAAARWKECVWPYP